MTRYCIECLRQVDYYCYGNLVKQGNQEKIPYIDTFVKPWLISDLRPYVFVLAYNIDN